MEQSVDDIDIPMSNGTSVCTGDWVSVESCVPEGGARLCGNDSGISCNLKKKLFRSIMMVTLLSVRSLQFPAGGDSSACRISFGRIGQRSRISLSLQIGQRLQQLFH